MESDALSMAGDQAGDDVGLRVASVIRELRRAINAWGSQRHPHTGAIDVPEADALDFLAEHGPSRIGTIAEGLRVADSTATRTVSLLANQGLVTKDRGAKDARVVCARLTPAGRRLRRELIARRSVAMAELLSEFSEPEQREFLGLLERFVTAMDRVGPGRAGQGALYVGEAAGQ